MDKYYPQYYHKTDKVSTTAPVPARPHADALSPFCIAIHSATIAAPRHSPYHTPLFSIPNPSPRRAALRPCPQEGRPVYIERLGLLDVKALYKITDPERQLKRLVYEYEKFLHERLPACSKMVGHHSSKSFGTCSSYDSSFDSISKCPEDQA